MAAPLSWAVSHTDDSLTRLRLRDCRIIGIRHRHASEDVASRTAGRGDTRSTATRTRCRAATRARRACRPERDGTRASSSCPRRPGSRSALVDAVTCEDRTTHPPAHTRSAVGAKLEIDSAAYAGTGEPLATAYIRAPDPGAQDRRLSSSSGRRAPDTLNPEVCSRASANRSNAASFSTRRRSFRISCRSSASVRSATSRLTTTVGAARSHPRAVERGTPREPQRSTGPRCVGPDPGADDHSVAAGGPSSACG